MPDMCKRLFTLGDIAKKNGGFRLFSKWGEFFLLMNLEELVIMHIIWKYIRPLRWWVALDLVAGRSSADPVVGRPSHFRKNH